jgi:hypothetical protein
MKFRYSVEVRLQRVQGYWNEKIIQVSQGCTNFPQATNYIKIVDSRNMTRAYFHTENLYVLGAIMQNYSVAEDGQKIG